jgi:hypothetical protein
LNFSGVSRNSRVLSGGIFNRSSQVSSSAVENPPKIQVHVLTGGIMTVSSGFHLNNVKVEGDICMINREGKKRRLETRMTKKTMIIMTSFIILQIVFLCSTILKQITYSVKDLYDELVLYYLQMILVCASFLSCFFNSLTFIIVTPVLKEQTKQSAEKVNSFFKERWNKLVK